MVGGEAVDRMLDDGYDQRTVMDAAQLLRFFCAALIAGWTEKAMSIDLGMVS